MSKVQKKEEEKMEQKVSSSYYYKVLLLTCNCVCVSVCNLHVNCVSFVCCCCCVVKIDWFSRGKKAWIFSRHNFRKQQKGKKNFEEKQASCDSSSQKKKTHQIFFIMAPSTSSSNNASFTKIFEQIHHKDRGVCYSARAFAFFLFFSLSTEEDRGNHRRRIS